MIRVSRPRLGRTGFEVEWEVGIKGCCRIVFAADCAIRFLERGVTAAACELSSNIKSITRVGAARLVVKLLLDEQVQNLPNQGL